ncbi:PAF acetylhydrolase [Chaetomium tenue]|uniref:PAF acetylhydrolase n=1 Tax=Chaetomium tenue TaxID=1854479 RepID=A0ACB7PSQ9_9PEZI|nr:PAF acetylhydrolase [Chaetomium globosum]
MQSLSLLLFLLVSTTAGYLLPNPPGKYNVTLTTGSLIDYSRDDPYAASPTPRALMLSVFQPTTCDSTVPVPIMPDEVAKYQGPFLQQTFNISLDLSPLFLEARLPVCPTRPNKPTCSFPSDANRILLFSPGYSIPRLYYNALASSIASQGFTVITIDHPFDANIILYPTTNHTIHTNTSIISSPTWDLHPRAADASFLLTQLANATAMAHLLPHRGPRPFPTDRVAMLGHSAGGAAAIVAASRDLRIRGAVNWDGTVFGSPAPGLGWEEPVAVMKKPVLFLSHQDFLDPSWEATWGRLRGPKAVVWVRNTTHYTFSDVPVLLEAAGQLGEGFGELLGTLEPARVVALLTAYTTEWMDGVFRGVVGGLFKGEEPERFPEAVTLVKGNF